MGRRYYCDYCDKTFIDDIEARKKHLNSAHHIKMRKEHYDTFRDLRTIYNEESAKIPCSRFLGSGFCYFDSNCKYSHYTKQQLWIIKQEILAEDESIRTKHDSQNVPAVDAWTEKYSLQKSEEDKDNVTSFWSYPEFLENRPDLPISLRKFKPDDFTTSEFNEWG